MSEHRAGSRSNGLPASTFTHLVDVDPRATGPLLERLREAGIAAYATPTVGSLGGYLEVRLPDRPTDRLWVNRGYVDDARPVVARELEELRPMLASGRDGIDEDAAWEQVVAGWDLPPTDPVPPWPVTEDTDDPPETAGGADSGHDGTGSVYRRLLRRGESSEADPLGPPAPDPFEQEEHYVPPPPPPAPKLRGATAGAAVACLLGVILLLAPGVLGLRGSDMTLFVAVLLILGGAGSLVWRMRDGPSDNDDPDDGAVV